MTSCWQSVGLDTSWKPKDTKFRTIFCSRTTRAQFFWRRMERLQAASVQNMSIFGISLLLIASTKAMYDWSGVQLET
jgi:hypothetical protein